MGLEKRHYNRSGKETITDIVKGAFLVSTGAVALWAATKFNDPEFLMDTTSPTYNPTNTTIQAHNQAIKRQEAYQIEFSRANSDELKQIAGQAFEDALPYGIGLMGGIFALTGVGYLVNRRMFGRP